MIKLPPEVVSWYLLRDPNTRYEYWEDLPQEILSSIFLRLTAIDILENAQKVCRSWRRVCKDPSVWRKIDMHNLGRFRKVGYNRNLMCRHAVDRSQGGLLEIDIWYFGTDKLLSYIADRSSNLRSLRIIKCNPITDKGLIEAVVKLPLLEYLEVSIFTSQGEFLKVAGKSCPNLKTLKLNYVCLYGMDDDHDARTIAECMSGLHHLQLCGNGLTRKGLNTILDGCPHLKHFGLLNQRYEVNLVKDLKKRGFERINLRHADDSTADSKFVFSRDSMLWKKEVKNLKVDGGYLS